MTDIKQTHTELHLREALRSAIDGNGERMLVPSPSESRTAPAWRAKLVVPVLAAAAVALATIPIGLYAARGPSADTSTHASDRSSTSDPLDSSSTSPTGQPGDLTLREVFHSIGYPFREPAAGDLPTVTEQEAIDRGDGYTSLGLTWVGLQHVSPENEATSPVTTTWRLTWVVVSPPRQTWVKPSKEGGEAVGGPNTTIQEVSFVDALTGELYAGFGIPVK